MLYTQQQYENALYALCRTQPRKFSKEFFKDYETIVEYIAILRFSSFDEKFIVRILKVVQPLVDNKKRFKRNSIVKLLKGHMKKRLMKREIKPETSESIFRFYKSLILVCNAETANDLSVTIKGIRLSNENLQWLIENANNSNYVLNRLLRYPWESEAICNWAKQAYHDDQFKDRESELIGRIIDFEPDYEFNKSDSNSIAWGIYYSRLGNEQKEHLLLKTLCPENADSVIEISERLGLYKVLDTILRQ